MQQCKWIRFEAEDPFTHKREKIQRMDNCDINKMRHIHSFGSSMNRKFWRVRAHTHTHTLSSDSNNQKKLTAKIRNQNINVGVCVCVRRGERTNDSNRAGERATQNEEIEWMGPTASEKKKRINKSINPNPKSEKNHSCRDMPRYAEICRV